MTDALTDSPQPAAATDTIAPPVERRAVPLGDEPAPEVPTETDGEVPGRDIPDPYAGGSFGGNLIRPLRRLYDRVLLAPVESFLTFFVVAFCVGFVFMNLHPGLLF